MTFHDTSQPMTSSPSDERLIDYLLGESVDESASGDALSDAAIERWLGDDASNAEHLESLAAAVLAIALPHSSGQFALGEAAPAGVAISAPGQSPISAPGQSPISATAVGPPVRVADSAALGFRAAAVGLLAVAAAITLAIFWSRTLPSDELSTQSLAIAWAETFLTVPATSTDGEIPAGSELDDDWSGDWELAEADDWLASDEGEAFAAGNDSPPQWLLTALAQMSAAPDFDSPEAEVLP